MMEPQVLHLIDYLPIYSFLLALGGSLVAIAVWLVRMVAMPHLTRLTSALDNLAAKVETITNTIEPIVAKQHEHETRITVLEDWRESR